MTAVFQEPPATEAALVFQSSLVLDVAAMLRDDAVDGVGSLLEQINRVGQEAHTNAVDRYSDRQGLKAIGSAMADYALHKLPLGLGSGFKEASYYAVRDLSVD